MFELKVTRVRKKQENESGVNSCFSSSQDLLDLLEIREGWVLLGLQERKDSKERKDTMETSVLEVHRCIFSDKECITHWLSMTLLKLFSLSGVIGPPGPRGQPGTPGIEGKSGGDGPPGHEGYRGLKG